METGGLGQILALVGLIVFVLTGLGRQRSRRRAPSPKAAPASQRGQLLGAIVAVALIVAGLALMAATK